MEDARLIVNPWNEVILSDEESTLRKICTQEEITRIAEGISEDPQRMRNVYQGQSSLISGVNTPVSAVHSFPVGLCAMIWDNVDWKV